jgi:hypothetical protein
LQQLQKRKQGHNDDYELSFCRLDNKRRIAVRIGRRRRPGRIPFRLLVPSSQALGIVLPGWNLARKFEEAAAMERPL